MTYLLTQIDSHGDYFIIATLDTSLNGAVDEQVKMAEETGEKTYLWGNTGEQW